MLLASAEDSCKVIKRTQVSQVTPISPQISKTKGVTQMVNLKLQLIYQVRKAKETKNSKLMNLHR